MFANTTEEIKRKLLGAGAQNMYLRDRLAYTDCVMASDELLSIITIVVS